MSSSLLSLKLSSSPTPSPTPHISSSPSRFLPSSLSLPVKNNYNIRRLCFKARSFHLPDAKSNELSDTKPPNVSLSKGRTEILQEFGKNVQPQFMEFLVNKAPQQVVGAMRQTVTNMIGTLSPQFFAVPVTTVAENLAQLMSSVPMIGHMFRNAQFRLEPQNSMDQVALPGVQEKAVGAASVIWLSVLILIFVHPVISSQAFATVQAAATSGGSSGAAAVAVGGWLIRTEILSSAWTGFFAGCLHTLSGPDHLAALAPLSIGRTRLESAAVGALWGCGHDAGQLIFGCLFLLLKDRLHIEIIRTWGTRVVGLTLLVIGAMGIKEASEVPAPCVALEDGECDVSLLESLENRTPVKKKIGVATFATGIIHGLQPDALVMVLPALALPSRLAGAAFLGMFLLGTVFSMGSYTVFIGSCSQALKERIPRITEKLTWASSLVAIALGFAILISQLFGFSLY